MSENVEVLYSEDCAAKAEHLQRHLEECRARLERGETLRPSLLFLKALHRVLNDDFQKSPELTLLALKSLYLLFTAMPARLRADFLQEVSPDTFLLVSAKIFAWELRRLDRIYARAVEAGSAAGLNPSLALQARLFTLLLLLLREIAAFYGSSGTGGDARLAELKRHVCDFGLVVFFPRLLDYEDGLLLRTALGFFAEFANAELALQFVRRGMLLRLPRFIGVRDFTAVFALLARLFSFPAVREELSAHGYLLRALVGALEQNQITYALQALMPLSLEPAVVAALVEADLDVAMLSLLVVFLRKEPETVEKNRLLWNLLINLASHACFADRVLGAKSFHAVAETLLRGSSSSGLRFLENLFGFAEDTAAKAAHGGLSAVLLEQLERCEESDATPAPRLVNLLAELYALGDRRPITVMMRLAKKRCEPALELALFGFLNKALFRPNFERETVSTQVVEHVLKRYLLAPLEDEARFQFLFFLVNLVVLRRPGFSFEAFTAFLERFAERDVRFLGFALTAFDVFLARAEDQSRAAVVRARKVAFCAETLEKLSLELPPDAEAY